VRDNYYDPKSWCAAGILLNLSDGITVQGNTLADNLCGLLLMTNDSTIAGNSIAAAREWPFSVLGDRNTVDRNLVNGCPYEGMYIDGIDNTLTCNRITNNDTGVYFDAYSTTGTPNTANNNVIAGNASNGIDASAVTILPLIDGTDNYWGCPTGADSPGCDTKVGNVNVTPFAVTEPTCVTCVGAGGDTDGDDICDPVDNCPDDPNPTQDDTDGDGIGDACDVCPNDPDDDIDGDGICGDVDICPLDPDNDVDGDGFCGDVDNCPADPNPGQEDVDADGDGDVCDYTDIAGLSVRKTMARESKQYPASDLWIVKAELDSTTTPGFAAQLAAEGVALLLLKQGGSGLVEVTSFSFAPSTCSEKNGSVICKDPATRSKVVFRKRSATDFFKVSFRMRRQDLTAPDLAETPLVVSVRTTGEVDRSDDIADCKAISRGVRCKEIP
jgi:hypothetical protein